MADFTDEDQALLDQLGIIVQESATGGRTPTEQRVVVAFQQIQRFVDTNGSAPQHGEDRDIFERLLASRLDRLRALTEFRSLVAPLDRHKLIEVLAGETSPQTHLDDDALLKELGVVDGDLSNLLHVRSAAEKKAAAEIANRRKCEEFDEFRPLFVQVKEELEAGVRQTRVFQENAQIQKGQWFVVEGQIAYVADEGESFVTEYDRRDNRLRVIYDNATESDVLMRSLQRALYRDGAGRRITDPSLGPLFSGELEEGDLVSGTIYVLRSKSEQPEIAAHRRVLHKIGVTGGDVARRIINTQLDPTFLMAEVELVATYQLSNINRAKLENLIHRIFGSARLDIEIMDRFGKSVVPREWFMVPLFVIDEVVERIKDGSITRYVYDPNTARLVESSS